MPENLALFQAVLDHPEDDAPRLAYAAWCDAHADPHGEFIRVQCALARLGPDDPQRPDLAARERALLQAHAREWIGIPELTTIPPYPVEGEPGMVEISGGPT